LIVTSEQQQFKQLNQSKYKPRIESSDDERSDISNQEERLCYNEKITQGLQTSKPTNNFLETNKRKKKFKVARLTSIQPPVMASPNEMIHSNETGYRLYPCLLQKIEDYSNPPPTYSDSESSKLKEKIELHVSNSSTNYQILPSAPSYNQMIVNSEG
jgi:hypothetical protein